ncbi:MAG: oxidoreductase [Rhodobacterales bacterium 32-67-9]|nr:MAG: oxidoreductase [Rhodobacterales bacterium 32-67-9]
MSVIVRDDGFHAEDYRGDRILEIATSTMPEALPERFDGIEMIRVVVPAFSDGRGFTLARHLRGRGYAGRLRATGPLIADQYAMARRSGFDEVEIPDDLAARQPEAQWLFRADWLEHDYRSRLKA